MTSAHVDPQHALEEIARRISPCPPPDVFNGYDICPTHPSSGWPCSNTEAAWLARGLDRTEQVKAALAAIRPPASDV